MEPEKEVHYFRFRKKLTEISADCPLDELRTLYPYAVNYCIRKSNLGQSKFLPELFSLYQEMISLGVLYQQGKLNPADVKNIVSLGIRLEEYRWTEGFLEQCVDYLPEEQKENSLVYNQAHLYYAKGAFRQAMQLLTQVEFDDPFYYPGAKTLLLKIYYELDEIEGLQSLIHAFQEWLRRNRTLSAYQKEVHQNLLKFLRKLQLIRIRYQVSGWKRVAKAMDRLRIEIHQTQRISQKAWLEEKWSEINDQDLALAQDYWPKEMPFMSSNRAFMPQPPIFSLTANTTSFLPFFQV